MNYDNDPTYDAMPVDLDIFTDEQLDNISDVVSDGVIDSESEVTESNIETMSDDETIYNSTTVHEDLGMLHAEMLKLNNFVSLIFAFIFLYMIYRVFRTCWNILYGWFFSDI